MFDGTREIFQKITDVELLSTVSFLQSEYSPESRKALLDFANSRGITAETIKLHRESSFVDLELEFKCEKCGCELVLEKKEFIEGDYTCPECGIQNLINYVDLDIPKSAFEGIGMVTAIAVGSLGGMVFIGARNAKLRNEKRDRILDGAYWKSLQAIADAKSKK